MQPSNRSQPSQYPYQIENCIARGNGNCRNNSLQKHLSQNKSSDELYERIKSPITPTDNEYHPFIHPSTTTTFDYHIFNGIHNRAVPHHHQNRDSNGSGAAEEEVTRFDQENSAADSDPESYLHSNSDLEEHKNTTCMPTESNKDICI